MMRNNKPKKIDFVIIHHFMLGRFALNEVVILQILWYKSRFNNNEFSESIADIKRVSGIATNTIKKAIQNFGKYGFLKCEDKRLYFLPDFESLIEDLKEQYILSFKREEERDKIRDNPTYTTYYFSVRNQLKIKEKEYCFLDTHIAIFNKKQFDSSIKKYIKKKFNISERGYYDVREKLFKKGHLQVYKSSEFIKVNDSVIKIFEEAKKMSKPAD